MYTTNSTMYSNRITTHAGYSWAANYQTGTAVRSNAPQETRIVEGRSLLEYQQELKAQRFGDNYEYREPGTCRNTNSIYPEYVKQQRMRQAAEAGAVVGNSIKSHKSMNADTDSNVRYISGENVNTEYYKDRSNTANSNERDEYRYDSRKDINNALNDYSVNCTRYEHGSSIYAIENVNYKKFMVTMAVLIAALVTCLFLIFVRNASANVNAEQAGAAEVEAEIPQEDITLTVGLVE